MKNIFQKLLLLTAVVSVGLLYSCGEDEETLPEAPTVTASALSAEYQSTDTARIEVSFTTPGELSGINYTVSVDGQAGDKQFNAPSAFGLTDTETSGTVTISFPDIEDLAGSSVSVEVEVVDKDNQTATSTATFDVVASNVNTYTQILLGAQGNSNEGFYDVLTNTRYSYAEARDASTVSESPIDVVYYYGATNENSLAAPDDGGLDAVYSAVNLPIEGVFGTLNSTTFAETSLTATEFNDVTTNAQLENAAFFEVGGTSGITNLSTGQVVAYQLDADRGGSFGLILISEINDTNGTGTITIEVKAPGME